MASNRKPFNDRAGYVASLKNPITDIHNVIYKAEEQGIDVNGCKYAVVCEGHKTMTGATSIPKARELMKDAASFCEDCRAVEDQAADIDAEKRAYDHEIAPTG